MALTTACLVTLPVVRARTGVERAICNPQFVRSIVADRSTALRRAAATGTGTAETAINGELFAFPDSSETVQEDWAADSRPRQPDGSAPRWHPAQGQIEQKVER